MPRETVYTPTHTTTDHLELSSHRDQPIQLAIDVGWTNGEPLLQLGITGVDPATNSRVVTGWFADLDWASCNRLIKILREARDRSHGIPQ